MAIELETHLLSLAKHIHIIYTYIKRRTIGFMHFGQKTIITTLQLSSFAYIHMCMSLYVNVRVYIKWSQDIHYSEIFTGQGLISQAPGPLAQMPS